MKKAIGLILAAVLATAQPALARKNANLGDLAQMVSGTVAMSPGGTRAAIEIDGLSYDVSSLVPILWMNGERARYSDLHPGLAVLAEIDFEHRQVRRLIIVMA